MSAAVTEPSPSVNVAAYTEIVATYRPALARAHKLVVKFEPQWFGTDRSRTAVNLAELELELMVLDNYAALAEREPLSARRVALVATSVAKIEALLGRRPFRLAPRLDAAARATLEANAAEFGRVWTEFREALRSTSTQ